MPGPTDDQLYQLLYPESPVSAPIYNVQDVELPDVEAQLGLKPSVPVSTPVSTTTKTGQGIGLSDSGFSPGKAAQVQEFGKGVRGDLARIEQKHRQEAAGYSQEYAGIANEEKAAAQQIGDIQIRKAREESNLARQEAEYTRAFGKREAELGAEAQVEQQAYLADYKRMMQEIRATTINPGKLFADMTKGEKVGTLVTAFVHDFLGSRGVKTSAMDTINRAVEQSIDAQIANLNNKKSVASGFKDMWEMQRAMSASDEEARYRMHGIALQAFKDDVASKMAMFNSELAGANILAATAEIDKKLLDNEMNLNNIAQQRINADKQLRLQLHGDELRAAQHAASIKLQRDEMDAAKLNKVLEAKAKQDADLRSRLIVDPSKNQAGQKRMWLMREGFDPKEMAKLQGTVNLSSNLIEMLNEYASLADEVGKVYDGPLNKFKNDTRVRRMMQLRNGVSDILINQIAATTFTDKLVDRVDEKLPKNTLLTAKSASQLAGQLANMIAQQRDTDLSGFTQEDIPDHIREQVSPTRRVEQSIYGADDTGEAVPQSGFASENREIAKNWRDNLSPEVYKADKIAGKINSDPTGKTIFTSSHKEDALNFFGRDKSGRVVSTDWFEKLGELKDMAINLDNKDTDRERAVEVLSNLAYESYGGIETEVNQAAKYYLNEVLRAQSQREGSAIGSQEFRGSPAPGNEGTVGEQFADDYLNNSAQSLYAE